MDLTEALGLARGEMLALIGAGGKTTTLFRLAGELRRAGGKILATTTTKIFKPAKPHVDRLFLVENFEAFLPEAARAAAPVVIAAGRGIGDDNKLLGLPGAWLDRLHGGGAFDAILVEADGAAGRGFKIPSETEPVIPSACTSAAWVISVKVLGQPWESRIVHRVERALALLQIDAGAAIAAEHIARLVAHPLGCLKGIPAHCRRIALINQTDDREEMSRARALAGLLEPLGFERIIITGYANDPPVKDLIISRNGR